MKLFCFPYAGGSALIYKEWQSYLGEDFTVRPFEMAGRGRRIREYCYNSLEEAVESILTELIAEFYSGSYCLFGHSMGAMIVARLLEVITERGLPKPEHVFFSGSQPPHLKDKSMNFHELPDDKFIELLRSYGGTPDEFFINKELLDFFLPLLRNDFSLANTKKESVINPCNVDISVLYGDKESDLNVEDLNEWKKYTTGKFSLHKVLGSHFFINENPGDVVNIIKKSLVNMVSNDI